MRKVGERNIVARELSGKICVSALLCKAEREPILKRNVNSTYTEVRDPESYDAMSKGESCLCALCKAKAFFVL